MRQLVLTTILLLASTAYSADIEVKKNPVPDGSFAVVKYKLSKGDKVSWKVYPRPVEQEQIDTETYSYIMFTGKGEFSVDAWIVNFDTKEQYIKSESVTIGGKVPPKPPPEPLPTDDVLLKPVQEKYDADKSSLKAEDIAKLGAVYNEVAKQIDDISTSGGVFQVIRDSSNSRIEDRLKPIRAIFGAELAKFLPIQPDAILTDAQKAETIKQLKRFATVLGAIK